MADSYNELFGLGSHSEDSALEGFWPLLDDAANTVVDDQSAASNNGTLTGGDNTADISIAGPFDTALDLDGTSDYIDLGDVAALDLTSTNFTLCARVRWLAADANDNSGILTKYDAGGGQRAWGLMCANDPVDPQGGVTFNYQSSAGTFDSNEQINSDTTVIDDGNWHHIAGVFTASTRAELFFDGTSAASTTSNVPASVAANTASVLFGSHGAGSVQFNGGVGEVAIFSRALSVSDIGQFNLGPELVNSTAPVVSGTETEGETLSCTTGTWALPAPFASGSNGTATYSYQWTRSDDGTGTNEADISGATSNTYDLAAADVSKFIRCRVRATNDGGYDSSADTNSGFTGSIAASSTNYGTVVVNNSSDEFAVGIPQNNGVYYDGTRYWLFYVESNVLKCKYGTSLGSMSDTFTDEAGTGNISTILNNGRCYGIAFGEISGTHYAWGLVSTTTLTDSALPYRWELTSGGLDNAIKFDLNLGDDQRNMHAIVPNYSGDVTEVVYASQVWEGSASTRYDNAALTDDTGLGALNSSTIDHPEKTIVCKLTDGYVCFAMDEGRATEINGNYGHMREWTRPNVGTAWGSEATIEGNVTGATANNGDFQDQNYGTNTSHAGQQDVCQLSDGTIYVAYCDNADLTDGDHGVIKLVKRGNAVASGWELIHTDVIGASQEAWHLALATDGTDVWILYVKDDDGPINNAIHCRKYDVSSDTLGSEFTVANIQGSHTFQRMYTQWRFTDNTLMVAWSEYDGSSNYDVVVEAVDVSTPITGTVTATLEDVTSTASAEAKIAASTSITLDDVVSSSSGTSPISGQATATLDDVVSTSAATSSVSANSTITLDDVTASATGGSTSGVTGQVTATLDDVVSSSAATSSVSGSTTATLDDVTATSSGVVGSGANVSALLEDVVATSVASSRISGASTVVLEDVIAVSAAGVNTPLIALKQAIKVRRIKRTLSVN